MILISSYYHHAQDEEIDTRRFGLSTVARLEGCITRATVIILYSLTSEYWKEVMVKPQGSTSAPALGTEFILRIRLNVLTNHDKQDPWANVK